MKNKITLILSLILIVSLSSCGVNRAWVVNQNQNSTEVKLDRNNYKVIGQVEGTAEVGYVLVFGGAKKTQLYNAAYSEMLKKAQLEAGARAVINVRTEEHVGGVPPFYYKRTMTVSASIIEFVD